MRKTFNAYLHVFVIKAKQSISVNTHGPRFPSLARLRVDKTLSLIRASYVLVFQVLLKHDQNNFAKLNLNINTTQSFIIASQFI